MWEVKICSLSLLEKKRYTCISNDRVVRYQCARFHLSSKARLFVLHVPRWPSREHGGCSKLGEWAAEVINQLSKT